MRRLITFTIIFCAGVLIGGYIFRNVQPRNFLTLHNCSTKCLSSKELAGLAGSVFLSNLPGDLLPYVVMETDKTVVMRHPKPATNYHYVAIPKRDIKHPADITEEDGEYLMDSYAALGELARKENLSRYRILTNGPGYQEVAYLHFHLMAN